MISASRAKKALHAHASPQRALGAKRFFKMDKSAYGYGDIFIGVTVPKTRAVAREFADLEFAELKKLITSRIHEERLLALIILVERFKKADMSLQRVIYAFYMEHREFVNNWDLVDTSAYHIAGYMSLVDKNEKKLLRSLAVSPNLWERRIAIVSTFASIRAGESRETFAISALLLHDSEDLIHKAVGWMLREVGKHLGKDEEVKFLNRFAHKMSRTTLRYSLEHFGEEERKYFLAKNTRA